MINEEISVLKSSSNKLPKNEEDLKPHDRFEDYHSEDKSRLDDFTHYTAFEDQGW